MTAKGALFALYESNLKVGRDLSLIAYDDNVAGTFFAVPLTTLFAPIRPLGRQLIRLLERAIAGEDYARLNHVLMPELIIRGSTGPANVPNEDDTGAGGSSSDAAEPAAHSREASVSPSQG